MKAQEEDNPEVEPTGKPPACLLCWLPACANARHLPVTAAPWAKTRSQPHTHVSGLWQPWQVRSGVWVMMGRVVGKLFFLLTRECVMAVAFASPCFGLTFVSLTLPMSRESWVSFLSFPGVGGR